ncbi:MAG: sulfatase [Planctomycetota bacterium]
MLLAGVAVWEFGLKRPAASPNIILIVLDTERADHVSCSGASARATTPFLDTLADKGLVFPQARSPSNWTLPAHASIFTGLLPSEHGCHFEHRYLVDEALTVAEFLQGQGYVTAGFSCNVNIGRAFNLTQGFDTYEEIWGDAQATAGAQSGDVLETRLAAWLRDPPGRPVFLFLNLMDAHLPYRAATGFEGHFGAPGEGFPADLLDQPDFLDRVLMGEQQLDGLFKADLTLLYDNAIRGLDARLQRVHSLLSKAGFLDYSVLIVTSDHGENLGDHGLVDHQASLHETVLRVPLILQGSGIPPGEVIDTPVSTCALYFWIQDMQRNAFRPDLIRENQVLISERMQPVALLERMVGLSAADRQRIGGRELAALFSGRGLKLLRQEGLPDRVVRVRADRIDAEELNTQEALELLPELTAALSARLRDRRVLREGDGPDPQQAEDLSGAFERMRQLGYLSAGVQSGFSVHAQEHLSRGVRAYREDDLAAALEEFERAAAIQPGFADALFNVALVVDRLGRPDARERWERYLDAALKTNDQDQGSLQHAYERLDQLR